MTTDVFGCTTTQLYDDLGRVIETHFADETSVALPEGQRSNSTYDANGNLLTYTDFNGEVMSYQYDEQNRRTFLDLEDDADVTYTYTLNGLQETIVDGRGTTEFVYDSRNRLIARKDPKTPLTADGFTLQYQYDLAGNRTQVRTPGGFTDYEFDERNRLETVTDSAQGETTYRYDSESNLTGMVLPSGIVESRKYDRLNRLTEIEQKDGESVVGGYTYELNAVGNRTAVTEADGRRVEYGYDDLDRLTTESITDPGDANDGRTYAYTYDDVGNRTQRVDSVEGTTTYRYDKNDRLLEEVSNGVSTTYTYDDNGNTLTKTVAGEGTTTYTWDDRNRLVAVQTADGDAIEYEYNEENIRVSSTVNGVETVFVVDGNRAYHQVLEEYVEGELEARYVYGLDLISVEREGEVAVYLTDGLGSTRALTDGEGNVVATYDYDAYGETIGSSGSIVNDYLFAGEQFDSELDQYYLRQRFYDQGTGRFGRRDVYEGSIFNPISLNKWAYGASNPVTFIDPSGLNFSLAEVSSFLSAHSALFAWMATGIGAVGTYATVVTSDPPSPVPFPFPGEGSVPPEFLEQERVGGDSVLNRILDFGRRLGGFGEGPQPDIDNIDITFPLDIGDLALHVFSSSSDYESIRRNLGIDIEEIQISNGVARAKVNITMRINRSDITSLKEAVKERGATKLVVDSGIVVNSKLTEHLNARVRDGKSFFGGKVSKGQSRISDFEVEFEL